MDKMKCSRTLCEHNKSGECTLDVRPVWIRNHPYDLEASLCVEFSLKKTMDFGDAIKCLKAGKRVARQGWNGKGMFLYHVPANSYPAQTQVAKESFGKMVEYGAYIAMKTAQGNVVPWLASQTDMLSKDWVEVAK
jgi:hypothetical protein